MADIYQIDSYDIIDRVSTFGGANLMRASGCSDWDAQYYHQDQTDYQVEFLGDRIKIPAGKQLYQSRLDYPNNISLNLDEKVLFSFYIYENTLTSESTSDKIRIDYKYFRTGSSTSSATSIDLSYTGLFTQFWNIGAENILSFTLGIQIPSTATGYIIIGPRKVELGNKPTDWSPCPYDLVTYDSTNQALVFFQ